jgi:pyruvate dehydrogenase E1 component alpha subunit
LLAQVRQESAPRALILHTCRFGPHSKGDDTRPSTEVDRLRERRDPLAIQAARLQQSQRDEIEADIREKITQAFEMALTDPQPSLGGISDG